MKALPNNSRVVLAAAVLTVLFATGCERRAADTATGATPPAESPATMPAPASSAPPATAPAAPAPVTPADTSAANDQLPGSVVDDTVITTKVKTALLADSDVKGLDVNVDTSKAVVTLNGAVNNQTQIDRAGKLATDVAGVKSVINNLTIKK
ncbi:hyperosmotically inducible protein [Herminiimonas fonticola]|uniref:Hyperosmotically inducible protein n=2 Tax=Herminiimonas fonticola TaxID=303380 RepID=A0A4R6GHW2_9BURK|nr:BON domain [Herminiimonas fonticola]TDN94569.1 hyperosmotically inducible protein [Herminiimonas fonticola]